MTNVIHRLIDRGICLLCGDSPPRRLPLGLVQRFSDARSCGTSGLNVRNDSGGKDHDEDLLIVAELLAQQTFKSGSLIALHVGHVAENGMFHRPKYMPPGGRGAIKLRQNLRPGKKRRRLARAPRGWAKVCPARGAHDGDALIRVALSII